MLRNDLVFVVTSTATLGTVVDNYVIIAVAYCVVKLKSCDQKQAYKLTYS